MRSSSKAAALFLLCCSLGAIAQFNLRNPAFVGSLNTGGIAPAITWGSLGSTGTTAQASSYQTLQSYVPTANALVVAIVVNSKASTPDTPTFSGNGLTWTQLATTNCNMLGSPTAKCTMFRSMGASPTSGTGTADFGGVNQTGCIIYVSEFRNVDTSGSGGSGAIVQVAHNGADAGANPLVTLSALTGSRNAVIAAFANDVNPFAGTPEAAWNEVGDSGWNTPTTGMYATYILATTDNTAGPTRSASDWSGIAIEIKAQ